MPEPTSLGTWLRSTAAPYLVHATASCSVIAVLVWRYRVADPHPFSPSSSSSSPVALFSLHVVGMTLAFGLAVPESLLMPRFAGFASKRASVRMHIALHVSAAVLIGVALYAIYRYHNDLGSPHLASLHSWVGAVTVLLFAAQFVSALPLFDYCCGGKRWCRCRGRFVDKRDAHQHLGVVLVLACALPALLTGLQEKSTSARLCTAPQGGGDMFECRLVSAIALSFMCTAAAVALALSLPRSSSSAPSPAAPPLPPAALPPSTTEEQQQQQRTSVSSSLVEDEEDALSRRLLQADD